MSPRVVADTNVLVSHFILPGRNPSKILDLALAEKLDLILSDFILEELERVLCQKLGFKPEEAKAARESIESISEIIKPRHSVDVVKGDESDNRILECSLSGKADVVVSGDQRHLLPLKEYAGIPILSPAEFLKRFL